MATPFKRICRQAIQQASRTRNPSSNGRSFAEGPQCHRPLSGPSSQNRAFSQSSRASAGDLLAEHQDEGKRGLQIAEEDPGDIPSLSNMSSTGYAELEQHRELRELVRVAAWEMPLLSSLSKQFTPPDTKQLPLRWRYTTYFGDKHPNSRKVVVMFNVQDLHELSEKQQEKLKKLCGVRYNPETNTVRMSCESFETQAQNKRYLGDTIQKLIAEAKDPNADSFEDVPLDTRHHKFTKKLEFPEEWKLTPEKQQALEAKRRALLLEEGKRVEENTVISGAAAIEAAKQASLAKVEEPIMASARQPLPRGRMGRMEMGQTRGSQR